jgi:hypothetical protein
MASKGVVSIAATMTGLGRRAGAEALQFLRAAERRIDLDRGEVAPTRPQKQHRRKQIAGEDSLRKDHVVPTARRTPYVAMGQKATWRRVRVTSALPPNNGHCSARVAGQLRARSERYRAPKGRMVEQSEWRV